MDEKLNRLQNRVEGISRERLQKFKRRAQEMKMIPKTSVSGTNKRFIRVYIHRDGQVAWLRALNVQPGCMISEMKLLIKGKYLTGFDEKSALKYFQLSIPHTGKILRNDLMVSDYNITENSMIHLKVVLFEDSHSITQSIRNSAFEWKNILQSEMWGKGERCLDDQLFKLKRHKYRKRRILQKMQSGEGKKSVDTEFEGEGDEGDNFSDFSDDDDESEHDHIVDLNDLIRVQMKIMEIEMNLFELYCCRGLVMMQQGSVKEKDTSPCVLKSNDGLNNFVMALGILRDSSSQQKIQKSMATFFQKLKKCITKCMRKYLDLSTSFVVGFAVENRGDFLLDLFNETNGEEKFRIPLIQIEFDGPEDDSSMSYSMHPFVLLRSKYFREILTTDTVKNSTIKIPEKYQDIFEIIKKWMYMRVFHSYDVFSTKLTSLNITEMITLENLLSVYETSIDFSLFDLEYHIVSLVGKKFKDPVKLFVLAADLYRHKKLNNSLMFLKSLILLKPMRIELNKNIEILREMVKDEPVLKTIFMFLQNEIDVLANHPGYSAHETEKTGDHFCKMFELEKWKNYALLSKEKTKLHVHKEVLLLNSKYFQVFFGGSFKDNNPEDEASLDVSLKCLELLVKFMYFGQLEEKEIPENDVLCNELLEASNKYLFHDLEVKVKYVYVLRKLEMLTMTTPGVSPEKKASFPTVQEWIEMQKKTPEHDK